MRDRLRVVAGAVVREGRVLAALRGPGRPLAGLWELPGGKVERGESDAEALRRELLEELGIAVQVGPQLGLSEWDGGRRPLLLVAYRCTLRSGDPSPFEHQELAWLRAEELAHRDWAPPDLPLLDAVRLTLCRSTPPAPRLAQETEGR